MKTLLAILLPCLACLAVQAQTPRIGFVDMSRAFDDYNQTKAFQSDLAQTARSMEASHLRLVEEFKALDRAHAAALDGAQNPIHSESIRADMNLKAQDYQRQKDEAEAKIRASKKGAPREMIELRQRVQKRIVDEIKAEINRFAAEQGYAAIFDKGHPGVLFAGNAIDVTSQLIIRLNQRNPNPAGLSSLLSSAPGTPSRSTAPVGSTYAPPASSYPAPSYPSSSSSGLSFGGGGPGVPQPQPSAPRSRTIPIPANPQANPPLRPIQR